jgi:hypothetical protein
VTAPKIATDAVETLKIKDLNVTTGKLEDNAVTTPKIATDAVETIKIKDLNVTTGKLADNAVTSAKINNGTITDVDISNTAAIQTSKLKGFYTGIFSIPSGSSGGASILVDVVDLIPTLTEVYSSTTIIFQSKSSSIMVKSSEPSDSEGDGTFDQILINFNASFATNQQFSYIIVLN